MTQSSSCHLAPFSRKVRKIHHFGFFSGVLGTEAQRGETKRYEHRHHATALGATRALCSRWVAGLVGGAAHLAAIFGLALVRKNKVAARQEVTPYAVSLAAVGAVISLYHYLLEWNPTWESNVCAIDVPCTTIWFRRFGFVSLPFMALCGFVSVVILLCTTYTKKSEVKETAQHMEKL